MSLYLRKNYLSFDEVLLIIHQAENLLSANEYEIPSALIMELVNSSQCSSYNCEFVALAQYLGVPLMSADKKILHEFPNIAVSLQEFSG